MIKYTEAELEIIAFDVEDVIVTSCGGDVVTPCDENWGD